MEKIEQSFVDLQNPVDFIKFVEESADDSNIEFDISLMSSTKKESLDGKTPVIFQIFTKGEFSDILTFSQKLENGAYIVSIKSLSIKKVEKSPASSTASPKNLEAHFLVQAIAK